MKIKIPIFLSEIYEGKEFLSFSVKDIGKEQSVRRDKELEDIYSKCSEDIVEKLFILFFGDTIFSYEKYIALIEEIYLISGDYCETNGFKGQPGNVPKNEKEAEMYFSPIAQKEIERVIYCSILLIPFFENKKLPKKIFSSFWGYFKQKNTVDLLIKIEKIVTSKYFGSSGDARFWSLAEMFGLTKDMWLLDTMTIITTKSLLKLEIDKSFAVYCQVIAGDSLMYSTKQNFTINLKQAESSKIANENPDSFINQMILEDELEKYIEQNPDLLNIKLSDNFPPHIRYLAIVLLDYKFDVSADLILKTASSAEYHEIVRRVAIDILLEMKCFILADLIKTGDTTDREVSRFFLTSKDKRDEEVSKTITRFMKNINDKSGAYESTEIKSEMQRFIKRITE